MSLKWLSRTLLALAATAAVSHAHAADPVSTISNPATGQCVSFFMPGVIGKCDGEARQNVSFGPAGTLSLTDSGYTSYLRRSSGGNVDVADALNSGGGSSGYWRLTASGHLESLSGSVSVPLCLTATGNAAASSGGPATSTGGTVVASQPASASTSSGTKTLTSPAPKTGTTPAAPSTAPASQAQNKLTLATCSDSNTRQQWVVSSTVAATWPDAGGTQMKASDGRCIQQGLTAAACNQPDAIEHFRFTAKGTISLLDQCLSLTGSQKAGTALALTTCVSSDPTAADAAAQQWKRGSGNRLLAGNGLCLGLKSPGNQGNAPLELQTCDASNAYQGWTLDNVAAAWPPASSTYVANKTLTAAQVKTLVDWIQAETSISSTPFCYKAPGYDRGVGTLPGCAAGQDMDSSLCYSSCRSGYHGVGPVCWSDQSTSYVPGQHCTAKKLGVCWMSAPDGCRSGYTSVAGVCWLNNASYGRGVGTSPSSCNSDREMQAGLCYLHPRTGYSCNVTSCLARCASGTADCGLAGCAQNAGQCANAISNMVVSPVLMFASLATAGAAGEAKVGVMSARNAVEIAKTASDLQAATVLLQSSIGNFMNMAEGNLAAISTAKVESDLAQRYGKGSANYRYVAREWAARQLLFYISDLLIGLDTLIVTSLDPTGITSTVDAFAKPTCTDHSTMPTP